MLNSVKEFHIERVMFYVWNGHVIIAPKNDSRGHKEFISNQEIYDKCVRGYYTSLKLVVYTGGDDFKMVETAKLQKIIPLLIEALNTPKGTHIYNGVKKGKLGDVWEPLQHFNTV